MGKRDKLCISAPSSFGSSLEVVNASWAFCHFLEAKLKWKMQGFYCNFPPHIYIIMGFVLLYSPHCLTEYILIMSLKFEANIG